VCYFDFKKSTRLSLVADLRPHRMEDIIAFAYPLLKLNRYREGGDVPGREQMEYRKGG